MAWAPGRKTGRNRPRDRDRTSDPPAYHRITGAHCASGSAQNALHPPRSRLSVCIHGHRDAP